MYIHYLEQSPILKSAPNKVSYFQLHHAHCYQYVHKKRREVDELTGLNALNTRSSRGDDVWKRDDANMPASDARVTQETGKESVYTKEMLLMVLARRLKRFAQRNR